MCRYTCINIHTHSSTKDAAVYDLIQYSAHDIGETDYAHSSFVFGVHPWQAADFVAADFELLVQEAQKQTGFFGIGECGIDRACSVPLSIQIPVFEQQLLLAITHSLPLIIHSVRAYSDILALLKKHACSVPILFHDFRGNAEQIRQLSAYNSFFCVGASVLSSVKSNEICRSIPLEQLFLETDTAHIHISEIYSRVAHMYGITTEDLQARILQNAYAVSLLK